MLGWKIDLSMIEFAVDVSEELLNYLIMINKEKLTELKSKWQHLHALFLKNLLIYANNFFKST